EILVDLVELLAHLLEDDAPDVGPGERGIQDVGILVQPDGQRLLLGLGRPDGQEDQPEHSQDEPRRAPHPHAALPPSPRGRFTRFTRQTPGQTSPVPSLLSPYPRRARHPTPSSAAISSICRQVSASTGMPWARRWLSERASGSPGTRISVTPAAGLADLTHRTRSVTCPLKSTSGRKRATSIQSRNVPLCTGPVRSPIAPSPERIPPSTSTTRPRAVPLWPPTGRRPARGGP